eukprot:3583456-Rhodomonas_salina.1
MIRMPILHSPRPAAERQPKRSRDMQACWAGVGPRRCQTSRQPRSVLQSYWSIELDGEWCGGPPDEVSKQLAVHAAHTGCHPSVPARIYASLCHLHVKANAKREYNSE